MTIEANPPIPPSVLDNKFYTEISMCPWRRASISGGAQSVSKTNDEKSELLRAYRVISAGVWRHSEPPKLGTDW